VSDLVSGVVSPLAVGSAPIPVLTVVPVASRRSAGETVEVLAMTEEVPARSRYWSRQSRTVEDLRRRRRRGAQPGAGDGAEVR